MGLRRPDASTSLDRLIITCGVYNVIDVGCWIRRSRVSLSLSIHIVRGIWKVSRHSMGHGEVRAYTWSEAPVQTRTFNVIIDLLSLRLVWLSATSLSKNFVKNRPGAGRDERRTRCWINTQIGVLVSRPECRSLPEWTRRFAPSTQNGHHLANRERATDLSILQVSGLREFSGVSESDCIQICCSCN